MATKMPVEATHADAWMMYAEDIVIPSRDTKDGPEHPRWRPDAKRAPARSLMHSIEDLGWFGVVEVARAKVRDEKTGAVVDQIESFLGVGRIIAVRALNEQEGKKGEDRRRIKVVQTRLTDEQQRLAIEAENDIRKVRTPMERAESAKRLLDASFTIAQVARAQGSSPASIRDGQKMLLAPKEAITAYKEGKITLTHVVTLGELPVAEAREKLDGWIKEPASLPTAKAAIREVAQEKKAPAERAPAEAGVKGPPGGRLVAKVRRMAEKAREEQKPAPVEDALVDVLEALNNPKAERGSLPEPVFNALHWLCTGKGSTKIAGLPALLKALEKAAAK